MSLSLRHLMRLHWPFGLLLLIVLPLLYFRLAAVPYPWYDEGLNINAVRSLATTGLYALPTAEGLRLADPAIQTGPPLIVPMALLYKLVGANLLAMRLVMTVIGLLTLVVIYAFVRRIYDSFAAFLTILFLLVLPGESTANFIMLSRQVLGEVPAILCLTLGFWLLLNPKPKPIHNLAIGLLFGLAVALKSQVLLILCATIGVWILYHLMRRDAVWKRWVIIAIVMMVIYGIDTLWRMGQAGDMLVSNSVTLREGIFIHILAFRSILNLLDASIWLRIVIMGGTLALVLLIRRRGLDSRVLPEPNRHLENFLVLLTGLWLLWYAIISIGWHRYAYVGEVFTLILFSRVVSGVWIRRKWLLSKRVYVALVVVGALAVVPLYVPDLLDKSGDQFYEAMDYLKKEVPSDARIVTWSWPASFFTGQDYIYPDTHAVNEVTRQFFYYVKLDAGLFDPLKACPDYVLLGSFEFDRNVLKDALAAANPTPIFQSGKYEIYAIPPDNLTHLPDGSCMAKTASS